MLSFLRKIIGMEEVDFKGQVPSDPDAIPYVPYTPPMVKMITQGSAKPPLCAVGDGMGEPTEYDVDQLRFTAFLHLVEQHEEWVVDTPLAMCRYVKPEGDTLFNIQACEDATRENARRRRHNKFVVEIFRSFMARYDCGASANRMTEPNPPPDFVEERAEKIKELRKDKLGTTQKAIEYLARFEIYCGRDYKFEEAFDRAGDKCFDETIAAKRANGRVRVRIEGRRPCWWNGSDPTDESGFRVKWGRGDGHTFLTPDVRPVEDDSIQDLAVVQGPSSVQQNEGDDDQPNQFASLFPEMPSATRQPLIEYPPEE